MMRMSPNLCPVEKQWTGGKITVDSGAAELVWPDCLMPEIQTKPSVGSQTGVTYIAANGSRMPNLGEKKVHFKTKDGLNSSITFQVTKVKKHLAAVSKITEKGTGYALDPVKRTLKTWRLARGPTLSSTTATAWTWRTSMSQVLRGRTGSKELDKTVQA